MIMTQPSFSQRLQRAVARALPELVFIRQEARKRIVDGAISHRLLAATAARRRRRLDGVAFVGITGSLGKTTTKELIAAVLSSGLRGTKSTGSANQLVAVATTIRRTQEDHDYCVLELGTSRPGKLPEVVSFARPRIGVVTAVRRDHIHAFDSVEALAAEKRSLVEALPSDGLAVLNADEPVVLAMAERCDARVITFGLSPEADVRAVDVSSSWPDRLSFTLCVGEKSLPVRTRLCGRHWVAPVLAAIAVGLELEISLEQAVRAIGAVEPFPGRMQPVTAPDGITFIRDDQKGAEAATSVALDFLEEARADRKVAVIVRMRYFAGEAPAAYEAIARRALEVADQVVFAGPEAVGGLGVRAGSDRERLRVFTTLKEADEYLHRALRPGDLVLLKGSGVAHPLRLILSRTAPVACWLTYCGRPIFCDECALIGVPSDPDGPLPHRFVEVDPGPPAP